MLRDKQHSKKDPPLGRPSTWEADGDRRVEALANLVDGLDLRTFLFDPDYRRRLNEVLAGFSDEEFDSFERHYTRRFTIN